MLNLPVHIEPVYVSQDKALRHFLFCWLTGKREINVQKLSTLASWVKNVCCEIIWALKEIDVIVV